MAKGRDVTAFYPDVVRNVIVKAVEVKKLVYSYLVHHAVRELALGGSGECTLHTCVRGNQPINRSMMGAKGPLNDDRAPPPTRRPCRTPTPPAASSRC